MRVTPCLRASAIETRLSVGCKCPVAITEGSVLGVHCGEKDELQVITLDSRLLLDRLGINPADGVVQNDAFQTVECPARLRSRCWRAACWAFGDS
jgi:hypothetical protein